MSLSTSALERRLITIPAVFAAAVVLTFTLPIWLVAAVVADGARGRFRLPLARLLAFGVCWAWLEVAGVTGALALFLVGRSRDGRLHFVLQRWWAKQLLVALKATCGIEVAVENAEVMSPGPVLVFVRHASLADALLTAYVVTNVAGLEPRFVLKRELLMDPCLDIVGNRMPNHFLDRGATDSAPELAALQDLVVGLGVGEAGVIFPEGTRANPIKRARAVDKIAVRDPLRAKKLAALTNVLPPRPSGARAMLAGAPNADVVVAWHVGFEGLDTFGGILKRLGRGVEPIRFVARRVPRCEVPTDDGLGRDTFTTWLDDQWIRMDNEVSDALAARRKGRV